MYCFACALAISAAVTGSGHRNRTCAIRVPRIGKTCSPARTAPIAPSSVDGPKSGRFQSSRARTVRCTSARLRRSSCCVCE